MEAITAFVTDAVLVTPPPSTMRAEPRQAGPEKPSSNLPLLDAAITEVGKVRKKLDTANTTRREASFLAIAKLHELRAAARADISTLAILQERSKLTWRKNTSEHLYITKAVLICAKADLAEQTVHDWSKVLQALDLVQVAPEVAQVVAWLRAPEDVHCDGKELTGHAKAFAIVKRETAGSPSNVAAELRAAQQFEKREQAWAKYVTSKLDAPLAEVMFAEPLPVAEGYVLQLARVEGQQAKVIDIVLTDEVEIQRLVRKHRPAA